MLKLELNPVKLGSFDLFRGLSNHFVTHGWLNFCPKDPSNAFSSTLRHSGEASQLAHYCPQPSPDLLRAEWSLVIFPWSQYSHPQTFGDVHFVVDHTDQGGPQLELTWLPQARLRPEQILFIEAEAVFYGETPFVSGPHFAEFKLTLPRPYEPAFQWVTPFPTGSKTLHSKYTQIHFHCFAQMQTLPLAHHYLTPTIVYAYPLLVGLAVRSHIVTLKAWTVFARCSSSPLANRHCSGLADRRPD